MIPIIISIGVYGNLVFLFNSLSTEPDSNPKNTNNKISGCDESCSPSASPGF